MPKSFLPKPLKSFLTGSRVYGEPREDSDIDLVIHGDNDLLSSLLLNSETGEMPLRFGKLNLIVLSSDTFEAWKKGTDELIADYRLGKPSSRDEAVAVIKRHLEEIGEETEGVSGN